MYDYAWQTSKPIYDKNASGKVYPDNAISGMEYGDWLNFEIEKDVYGRVVKKSYSRSNESETLSISYEYYNNPEENGTRLTNLVKKQVTRVNGEIVQAFYYSYDKNGNISTVEHSDYPEAIAENYGVTVETYVYDGMNQLVREDNRFFDKTVLCTYDNSGNILTKKEYVHNPETPTELLSQKNYSYPSTGWKDKLTSVNNQPITYDALGNPLSYLGHALTWDKVRQLKTFDNNTFSYNSEGMRTKKNDIDYIYHNGKLFIEQRGFNNRITYYYDESGIAGFTLLTVNYDEYGNFNGLDTSKYVFEKNLQGDVIGIYNDLGRLVAQYRYDAWGNCMITQNVGGMATFNAIRYRGYYYDNETGLYYLKSRYYDPNTGRFINADVVFDDGAGLLGYNLYSYCSNNPIVYSDPSGKSADSAIEIISGFLQQLINKIRDFICVKDNTYLNETQMQLNATLIYLYLKRQKWSDNAIFAVLGNMQSESTISPGRYQVNGGAFGLVQWDPATKYTDWAVDNGYANDSVTGQLLYLINSMQPGQGEWFRNKNYPAYYLPANEFICSNASVDYLTLVFLYSYERPRNPDVNLRKNNALYWSNYFN